MIEQSDYQDIRMMEIKEIIYNKNLIEKIANNANYFFVGDIGGTNSNFGVLTQNNNALELLFSLHAKSQNVNNFSQLVNQVLKYIYEKYNIKFEKACFAVAGEVLGTKVNLTNANFIVDSLEIQKNTDLKTIYLINDFQAVGYGIDAIDQENIICVKPGKSKQVLAKEQLRRVCFGPGTGLGKTTMYLDSLKNKYHSLPSEGGHANFPAHNEQEFELIKFISKEKMCLQNMTNITWEDVLSGRGISRIYKFLKHTSKNLISNYDLKIDSFGNLPQDIFGYKDKSQLCIQTFNLYSRFFGRCARNFAIDFLAYGGIYIGGGIAPKNLDIFKSKYFLDELSMGYGSKESFNTVPVYVLTDYNVSLYGAAEYLIQKLNY